MAAVWRDEAEYVVSLNKIEAGGLRRIRRSGAKEENGGRQVVELESCCTQVGRDVAGNFT